MLETLKERIIELLTNSPNSAIGVCIGIGSGLIILLLGWKNALLLLLCGIVGFFVGKLRE